MLETRTERKTAEPSGATASSAPVHHTGPRESAVSHSPPGGVAATMPACVRAPLARSRAYARTDGAAIAAKVVALRIVSQTT